MTIMSLIHMVVFLSLTPMVVFSAKAPLNSEHAPQLGII